LKDKTFLEFVKYELETIKTNKFLFLKGIQYNFSETDPELVSITLKIVILFIKNSKLYSKINEINKNEFYLDYFIYSSNFLNWFNNIINTHYFNTKIFRFILELLYELISEIYGIQIFNIFKTVDIRFIISGFNIDTKYLISATFNQRFHYYTIIKKITELIKPDLYTYSDFLTIPWNILIPHFLSTYVILNKNPYFKLPYETDISFNYPYILVSQIKSKLFTNKTAIQIQCKYYEILSCITFNTIYIQIIKNHNSFNKIIQRILFLAIVKIDDNTQQVFSSYHSLFFLMYSCFINIINNLNKLYNINDIIKNATNELFPGIDNKCLITGLEEKLVYFKTEKNDSIPYLNILKNL
jgi:hypothetical protein